MIKKFFLFISSLFIFLNSYSIELSDSLRVSVLTVAPGNELYSTFGHTAIRVKDLLKGYDIIFNYGTFDFNTTNFYLKFAFGKLDYMLSVESFEGFITETISENRTIDEQVLNFNKLQKMNLVSLLISNYEPQKKFYRYKFFTDNCSTRIRDIISIAANDSLILKTPKIAADISFRKLFTKYLENMPWPRFGIELLMGKMTDNKAGYDALFLPDNLKEAFSKAKLKDMLLIKSESRLFTSTMPVNKNSLFSPLLFAILILILAFAIQLKKLWTGIFDGIFFAVFGFLGIFIFIVCSFSDHAELNYNLVILLLLPTNIIVPFLSGKIRKYYSLSAMTIIIITFICLPFLPQKFNLAVLILALAIGTRLFFNFVKKNQHK